MSTSEPNKDEAPASETTAAPSEPEPEPEKTAAKPDDSEAEPAADRPAADQTEAAAKAEAAAAEKAQSDEPVWPPPESQPVAPEGKASEGNVSESKASDTPPATDAAAVKPSEEAAEPGQEMALSESTLHWLVDGELPIEPTGPTLVPIYDSHAPVAGRKRAVAVIGGAAVLALVVALVLHALAAHSEKTAAVPPSVGSADLLIHQAEAALAQGRSAEALDLAHLATVTDPHYADAYVVIGGIQRSNGQAIDARDAYRHYLDLAPLGSHAAEARAALKTLPP